jgi:hypothetical protein
MNVTSIGAILASILLVGSSSVSSTNNVLPNHHRIPGWYNPLVTDATVDTTVCNPGYSRSIRPPASYTSYVKKEQVKFWNLPQGLYEEDHFVPLSVGGSPYDTRNLWPEPIDQARQTDKVELKVWRMLCQHSISLKQAQTMIIHFKMLNG